MKGSLTVEQRQALHQLQKQRRDDEGYVKITMALMLGGGWSLGSVAEALGLDEATVYRYVYAFTDLGLVKYLAKSSRAIGAC